MNDGAVAEEAAPPAQSENLSPIAAAVARTDSAEKAAQAGGKATLGEKLGKDPAWQRAYEALQKQSTPPPAEAGAEGAEGEAAEGTPAEEQPPPEKKAAKELESDKYVEAIKLRKRAEREAAERQRELEARRAELEAKQKDVSQFTQAQELLKSGDALGALKLLGVDYSDLTKQVLSGPKKEDPAAELRAKLEELEKWKEESAKSAQEREQEEFRRGMVVAIRAELADKADLAALKKNVPHWEEEVFDLMSIRWEQAGRPRSGSPITAEEAAVELRDFFLERKRQEIEALKESSPEFLQSLGLQVVSKSPSKQAAQSASGHTGNGMVPGPKTLTGAHAGESGRLGQSKDPAELKRRARAVAEQLLGPSQED